MADQPHTLTLRLTGDEYDPEMPLFWDEVTLSCPYPHGDGTMPCAVWEPCGCKYNPAEITDIEWDRGEGPCEESPTGRHVYMEGEPHAPRGECWAVHHADGLEDSAGELQVGPGIYDVWPRCVEGLLELNLVDPAARRADTATDTP